MYESMFEVMLVASVVAAVLVLAGRLLYRIRALTSPFQGNLRAAGPEMTARDSLDRSICEIRVKSRLWLYLLAIVLMAPGVTHAARPLITDDAGTVGKGKMQVELGTEWFSWQDTVDDVRVKETGTEASGVLTYGLLESIDLVAGFPYVWSKAKEDGHTVFSEDGLNDISLEVKWHFFEKHGFGLALKPGVTLPTGDYEKGFGTGRVTYGLSFIASKELQPFAVHLNAGYTRNENKLDEREHLWSASLAATYKVIEGLNAVGDIGFARNADPTLETAPAFALVGFNYAINDHVMLDAGYKFGLNKSEGDYSLIAGVTFNF